jgi:hypothetical protein
MSSLLTLTSLLNSLHSHLQSQTQLLPTLHLQLGLPPSALEDELRTIEQQLLQSVEGQINNRRKEVEHWSEKCETVEKECILYVKALGVTAKSSGCSVGELRKEQVLPKRYELVSSLQEGLRQVSHDSAYTVSRATSSFPDVSCEARTTGHINDTDQESRADIRTRLLQPRRFVPNSGPWNRRAILVVASRCDPRTVCEAREGACKGQGRGGA